MRGRRLFMGAWQKPNRAEPNRAEPSRTEPSRAEPSRAAPKFRLLALATRRVAAAVWFQGRHGTVAHVFGRRRVAMAQPVRVLCAGAYSISRSIRICRCFALPWQTTVCGFAPNLVLIWKWNYERTARVFSSSRSRFFCSSPKVCSSMSPTRCRRMSSARDAAMAASTTSKWACTLGASSASWPA